MPYLYSIFFPKFTIVKHQALRTRKSTVYTASWLPVYYSNSSHMRLIPAFLVTFALLFVTVLAILTGIILTVIEIVLKMYSYIKPIIYYNLQNLSLVIAFVPEFFYQILKFCHGYSTIHFVPIFLLKKQHFMHRKFTYFYHKPTMSSLNFFIFFFFK